MTLKSMHVCAAGLAIAVLRFAAPASAQVPPPVTFEQVRDAVPGKFYSADATHSDPASPNTLHIGLEGGANAFRACAPFALPLTPVPCNDTRVAMDTLSFVVTPPAGYYVSSITYDVAGTGAISRLDDARGSAGWVVGGLPMDLDGPFGGAAQFPAGGREWSRSRTLELSNSGSTAVPVSLTTGLFAYAAAVGEAHVDVTSATVAVTIAPVGPAARKTATFAIQGFAGTYDGHFHEATGTATGPGGEDLGGRLQFDPGYKDAPGGLVNWNFPADDEYNGASGTVEIIINPADATIVVTGFSGTYDGLAHGATGTATGISNIAGDLNAHLDLGASFTNVPGGVATWTFSADPNYHAATGTVNIAIGQATPVLTWPAPAAIAAGTALSSTQLNATASVDGTFVYTPPAGTILAAGTHSLSAAFTPADAVNYAGATATVSITVNAAAPAPSAGLRIENPGPQTDQVGEDVRIQIEVSEESASRASRRRGSKDDDDDDDRGRDRLKGKFDATGLPPGLRIEDDGEIRGKPKTVGIYNVVVSFTKKKGGTVSTAFDWTIAPKPPKGKKK